MKYNIKQADKSKGWKVHFNIPLRTFSLSGYIPKASDSRLASSGWRVVLHTDKIALQAVMPIVSESGRQRVLETGQKNVHAWLWGLQYFIGAEFDGIVRAFYPDHKPPRNLSYHPRRSGKFFFYMQGVWVPLHDAHGVIMTVSAGKPYMSVLGPLSEE